VPLYVSSSGREALEYFRGEGKYSDRNAYPLPSGILLDLKLPHVDGLEVLQWAKQQPSIRDIPVVMISGFPTEADRLRAWQMGAAGFFEKPLTADNWIQISQLLDKFATAR
jgi:CheY-like chemotaxis protein